MNFAVIVTYNPNIDNVLSLLNILTDNDFQCIVVDNNSNTSFLKNKNKYSVINLEKNLGIAKAQNIGINKAVRNGADYIIFFDQDSTIDQSFLDKLTGDFLSVKKSGVKLAAIGPQFIDKELGFYAPGLLVNRKGLIHKIDISQINEPKKVGVIISSGSLVSTKALIDIGFMNEDLFIDYVDTEWCLRALNKGYKIYISNNALMYHSIGEKTVRLGSINCPVHSPYRRYYRIRILFLLCRMIHISKLWIANMFLNNFIATCILFATQKNKIDYIKFLLLAVRDGLSNKKGILNEN